MAHQPTAWLSFRDFAAIQIAAAMKSTARDLSPRETAEVAFDLAAALEEERGIRCAMTRAQVVAQAGLADGDCGTGVRI